SGPAPRNGMGPAQARPRRSTAGGRPAPALPVTSCHIALLAKGVSHALGAFTNPEEILVVGGNAGPAVSRETHGLLGLAGDPLLDFGVTIREGESARAIVIAGGQVDRARGVG